METPNLEEYGHAVARAALDAARAKIMHDARYTLNGPNEYSAGVCCDTIRALMEPAALAEIVGRVKG